MTRLKKEIPKKNSTTDRIRRIKDQKKVINCKNVVKVRDTNFKRFLEGTIQDKSSGDDIYNNNDLVSLPDYPKETKYHDETKNIRKSTDPISENLNMSDEDEKGPRCMIIPVDEKPVETAPKGKRDGKDSTVDSSEQPSKENYQRGEDKLQKPAEEKLQKPAEEKLEKLAEEKLEKPAEEKLEQPVEENSEQPAEENLEQPAEENLEQPAEENLEQPAEENSEQPAEENSEQPAEENLEQPAEENLEQPAEENSDQTAKENLEQPAEEKSEIPTSKTSENQEKTKPLEEALEQQAEEAPVEEIDDFELVGLSPESQKTKSAVNQQDKSEPKISSEEDLKNEKEKPVNSVEKTVEATENKSDNEDDDHQQNRRRQFSEGENREIEDESEGEVSAEELSDRGRDSSGSEDDVEIEGSDYDDETESRRDEEEQEEDDEHKKEEEEEEEVVKSPTYVPRRTGFWDHDNRFSDIAVEESREPPQNSKKLWDKSEVQRWRHDMYDESMQGPKESWEIEESQRNDDRRRGADRRQNRNFGEFVPQDRRDGNRNQGQGRRGDRSGGGGQNYDRRNQSHENPNYRSRDQNRDDQDSRDVRNNINNQRSQDFKSNRDNRNNRDRAEEWPSLDSRKSGSQNRNENQNRRQNKRLEKEETWNTSSSEVTDWGPPNRNNNNRRDQNSRRNQGDRRPERNSEKRNTGQNHDIEDRNNRNDQRQERRNPGNRNDRDDGRRQEVRQRQQTNSNEDGESETKQDKPRRDDDSGQVRPGKGRGKGYSAKEEKTNREKRIDSLPPRLRDQAREKMYEDERDKNRSKQQYEGEQYNEQYEDAAVTPPDGGGPRDKPKRYSSQRQKTGTSMLDIPSQIPENEDTRQYLEQLAMLQQMTPDKDIRALEQQILNLQGQLQQQLNLRSQQQIPNIMAAQSNMGMQMPNMVSPIVQGVDQQVYADAIYNMAQGMVPNGSGDAMGILNPQINPMILNQIIAAAQAQQGGGGGMYLPPQPMQSQQSPQQPQQQQVQMHSQVSDAESRRSRPAAIPIKAPPGL